MVCFLSLVWWFFGLVGFPRPAAGADEQRALAASEILGGRQAMVPDDPGLPDRNCSDAARRRENCRCVGFMVDDSVLSLARVKHRSRISSAAVAWAHLSG